MSHEKQKYQVVIKWGALLACQHIARRIWYLQKSCARASSRPLKSCGPGDMQTLPDPATRRGVARHCTRSSPGSTKSVCYPPPEAKTLSPLRPQPPTVTSHTLRRSGLGCTPRDPDTQLRPLVFGKTVSAKIARRARKRSRGTSSSAGEGFGFRGCAGCQRGGPHQEGRLGPRSGGGSLQLYCCTCCTKVLKGGRKK